MEGHFFLKNISMFNSIAKRYDLLNKIISLGLDSYWRARAIRQLNVSDNGGYLDIGCGTGDLSIEILKFNKSVSVTGIDPSEEMLKIARNKNKSGRINFINASAVNLPFGENEFNGTICGFCIRNVVEKEAALREMRRVLKNGSKCVILELSYPEHALIRLGYNIFNAVFIQTIAKILSVKDAYSYLIESIKDFPSQQSVIELMEKAGFKNCKYRIMSFGVVTIYFGEK